MHKAGKPKPVAAMLDRVRVSEPWAAVRSFPRPVAGLPCSQKNLKVACCTEFKRPARLSDSALFAKTVREKPPSTTPIRSQLEAPIAALATQLGHVAEIRGLFSALLSQWR